MGTLMLVSRSYPALFGSSVDGHLVVFSWSIYNGSTYYIDVFGKRFQKELEGMKQEVAKWQTLADAGLQSLPMEPQDTNIRVGASAASLNNERQNDDSGNLEVIPLLEPQSTTSTCLHAQDQSLLQERNGPSKNSRETAT